MCPGEAVPVPPGTDRPASPTAADRASPCGPPGVAQLPRPPRGSDKGPGNGLLRRSPAAGRRIELGVNALAFSEVKGSAPRCDPEEKARSSQSGRLAKASSQAKQEIACFL